MIFTNNWFSQSRSEYGHAVEDIPCYRPAVLSTQLFPESTLSPASAVRIRAMILTTLVLLYLNCSLF